jgi:amino acid transporter
MKKTVLTFGLIAGGILSVMMALTLPFKDSIGFDTLAILGYTSMVAAFLLVFFGVKSYRDNVAGGHVGFWRAFGVGSLIVVVASVCYVATWQVIYHNFATDFIPKYQAHVIEKARASGATQLELDTKIAEMQRFAEWYRHPALNAAITFLEPLPVGLVIALVSAGILRRRKEEDVVFAEESPSMA